MTPTFRITPRAQEDLRSIGRYTGRKWCKQKRDSYLYELDKRFAWLAQNPKIGKHRPDIEEGYYCYLQGAHLILYTIGENCINIISIPHKVMDILSYFEPN